MKSHSAKRLRDLKSRLRQLEGQLAKDIETTDSGNMARYFTGSLIDATKIEISELSR